MRRIFIAWMLLAASAGVASAGEAQGEGPGGRTITLTCDGTISTAANKKPVPVTNMNVVVNLATRSVVGFGDVIASIDRVDATGIAFSGNRRIEVSNKPDAPASDISVVGFLGRSGGAATATVTAVGVAAEPLAKDYDLRCRRISKLFFIDK